MIILRLKLVDGTLTFPHSSLILFFDLCRIDFDFPSFCCLAHENTHFYHHHHHPPWKPLTGDLNKALKDLVTVITDQEIEQSDLNENEIEWADGS